MSSSIPVTAIFDIGKTNKKFLLFDDRFNIVYSRKNNLDETTDNDGFPCEDIEQLNKWIQEVTKEVAHQNKYVIRQLNVSAYGATLVHLDKNGDPTAPMENYLKPYPEELKEQFYDTYGGRNQFSTETASPPMGMLNSGLQLYRIKHENPELLKSINATLHLPQYISYLFTGRKTADLTSIGCHTGMWNYRKNTYHPWLKKEKLQHLLPDPELPKKTTNGHFESHHFETGIGIHDSSAALVPYLIGLDEPFIQLSTGTWSIAMNPFTQTELTYDDLERDCLQYLNIYGEPVKASRLLLGAEYSHQLEKISAYFNKNRKTPGNHADPTLLKKLINNPDPDRKLILEKAGETGPHPHTGRGTWNLDVFNTFREACHQLMLDLVSIQTDAIRLAEGETTAKQIIVTGGFANNSFFCRLLATHFPDKKIYTASTSYASALGAALVMNIDTLKPGWVKDLLGLNLVDPIDGVPVGDYAWNESHNQTL
ncbi:carbohydrate kinase [Rhodohalobacter sp. SW132]|uniref:FGGY-family carbohydrate kinase n=1 Tax=Rhodohalobacter sp. SW132 TaxID=2293433 RepID=UPI000E2365A3|nr:FGGY family carbohydrate kinase [Rhodohalobacter sp. SW132]REL24626.1 carbohydrate kinase [Rhodohalobacter sp. SW132]